MVGDWRAAFKAPTLDPGCWIGDTAASCARDASIESDDTFHPSDRMGPFFLNSMFKKNICNQLMLTDESWAM
ncbi:hypothetical protein N7468_008323 [Penicillium chermesinum]|uniref:Uncharacterized protein n=1 Tax=Penicillium chermesinum TaxID=63820 RepID=A0A9W9NPU6_9EURO|nr:uncharacterized protein N7468_008323 [Penicillium chermesinum]KAJ5223781.1 hypothetical protein N7468_008323 [Penicillium chermesinum]